MCHARKMKKYLVAITLPTMMTTAPLDPVTLIHVMDALIGALFSFDAGVLQFVAVLDAGTQLPMFLHHQLLHVLIVAIQQ